MKTLWLPLLLCSLVCAERQYFLMSHNATWDAARNYCRDCFEDLAPITSADADLISKKITMNNLTSEQWIGLRYNATIPSFRWSNEEPVTYQNWFPGHPVPNKVKKMIEKCFSTTQNPTSSPMPTSTQTTTTPTTVTTPTKPPVTATGDSTCQFNATEEMCPVILFSVLQCLNMTYENLECAMQNCTCDAAPTVTPKTTMYSSSTAFSTSTASPSTSAFSGTTDSTTNSNCILEPEPDHDVYIEDACVALLGFGMWKEKQCNESLPFICYAERFLGEISVSNVTKSSANVSWTNDLNVKNISHYRVEITGDTNQTHNVNDTYKVIENLTAGHQYNVQVFPVRCERDLNPEYYSFYTIPSGIKDLTVISVTSESIFLSWTNPEGGFEKFFVFAKSVEKNTTQNCIKTPGSNKTFCNIIALYPGTQYTFTIKAVVNESEGESVSILNYVNPSRVLNLTALNSETTAINATWTEPLGKHSGYCYCLEVANDINCMNCNLTNCNLTKNNSINDGNKLTGTKYRLCVIALTNNDSIPGETVGILTYTIPNKVNLNLRPDSTFMIASWTIVGNYDNFSVKINTTQHYVNVTTYNFTGLQAGVYYTVTVIALNGDLQSNPTNKSDYTKPVKPGPVTATVVDNSISLTWEPPNESKEALINYTVKYYSTFWKTSYATWTYDRNYTFRNLSSGTTYMFNVAVCAGIESLPSTASAMTLPKKQTLTFAMMCSSETPLNCGNNETMQALLKELQNRTGKALDGVYWKLTWVKPKNSTP